MSLTHRVETNVVKTSEGHIGLFPSSVIMVREDLSCNLCDFVAPKPSNLVRHMSTQTSKGQTKVSKV